MRELSAAPQGKEYTCPRQNDDCDGETQKNGGKSAIVLPMGKETDEGEAATPENPASVLGTIHRQKCLSR